MKLGIAVLYVGLSLLCALGFSASREPVTTSGTRIDPGDNCERVQILWSADNGDSSTATDAVFVPEEGIYVLVNVYPSSVASPSQNEPLGAGSSQGFRLTRTDPDGATENLLEMRGPVEASSMCYDPVHARIYVSGGFSADCVDFDPGTKVDDHVGLAQENCFLSAYGLDGGYEWTSSWNGSYGCDVLVDNKGSVYVAGEYGWEGFDTDTGVFTRVPSGLFVAGEHQPLLTQGQVDAFLIKYTELGDAVWLRTWGGPSDDRIASLVLISPQDIAVGGYAVAPFPWNALPVESKSRLADVVCVKCFHLDGTPRLQSMFDGETVMVSSICHGASNYAFGLARDPYQVFRIAEDGLTHEWYWVSLNAELSAIGALEDGRVLLAGNGAFQNESQETPLCRTVQGVQPGQAFCGYLCPGGSIQTAAVIDRGTGFCLINGFVVGGNDVFVFGDVVQTLEGTTHAFLGRFSL